jgi:hypothetical protein
MVDVNLLVMATLVSGMMEKLKAKLWRGSETEVAVMVAFWFSGATAGGVYTALKLGDPEATSVPHPGEQPVLATDSDHVTPAFDLSLVTTAFSVTAASPA